MSFLLQWIEEAGVSLPAQLDTFAEKNPGVRLVSVMMCRRNPGENQVYKAVWESSVARPEGTSIMGHKSLPCVGPAQITRSRPEQHLYVFHNGLYYHFPPESK